MSSWLPTHRLRVRVALSQVSLQKDLSNCNSMTRERPPTARQTGSGFSNELLLLLPFCCFLRIKAPTTITTRRHGGGVSFATCRRKVYAQFCLQRKCTQRLRHHTHTRLRRKGDGIDDNNVEPCPDKYAQVGRAFKKTATVVCFWAWNLLEIMLFKIFVSLFNSFHAKTVWSVRWVE